MRSPGRRTRAFLFQEKCFADLIAAHKGLRGAEPLKQVEDFAILEDAGMHGHGWRGHRLDRLAVDDAIIVKAFSRAAVKHRENYTAGMKNVIDALHHERQNLSIEVIAEIPCEDSVKAFGRIVQVGLQEFCTKLRLRTPVNGFANGPAAHPFLFLV